MKPDPVTDRRKVEHIRAIETDPGVERDGGYFDAIKLTHRALPEIALDEVDTSTTLFGKKLAFPLLISSMTGGTHELAHKINKNLAIAAQHCGVAMGLGSQRVMFETPEAASSFDLRKYAPDVALIANLGAVQLNYGFGVEHCQDAVDVCQADALYLHLNPLQEAIQPEGDTNFSNLSESLTHVANSLEVPVILKEVGCGLSVTDIDLALRCGITHFDIAGSGGTSWARIEHHRRDRADSLGLSFQDWGLPTPQALIEARAHLDTHKTTPAPESDITGVKLFASGGLRSGIDMVKALILGADLCAVAAPLLKPAMTSVEETITTIAQLYDEFRIAMFLLGADRVEDLINNRTYLSTPTTARIY